MQLIGVSALIIIVGPTVGILFSRRCVTLFNSWNSVRQQTTLNPSP